MVVSHETMEEECGTRSELYNNSEDNYKQW